MDWINHQIALGDIDDGRDPERVDAVLNVAAEVPVLHNLPCFHLKIEDQQPITRRDLSRALRFLTERTSVDHNVLVHCNAGISRSPAVVAAFLSATTGTSAKDTLTIIRQKRWIADPDPVVWQSILAAVTRSRSKSDG